MTRFYSILFYMLISLLSSNLFAQPAQQTTTTTTTTTPSGTVVERKEIITTVPAPKVVIERPSGYVSCFKVKAGWYQNVWVADHSVCTYSNSPLGTVWVEGYWSCNKYDEMQGKCTNWDWKDAHWESTVTGY